MSYRYYYQPQIATLGHAIVGAEVLLRWYHPQCGFIAPAQFIPLAEETGIIEPLGRWVLHQACQQLQTWRKQGLELPRIAVNLSAHQFNQGNFYQSLTEILQETGIPPQFLELELTEGTLIDNVNLVAKRLNVIRDLGVKIAIDDFGTGYSSLSYLYQFSFDTPKIDRVFVNGIDKNRKNSAIAQAIITMAHQLQLNVIAEGVETREELKFLRDNRCHEIQGYLFSPPVPQLAFEELLTRKYVSLR